MFRKQLGFCLGLTCSALQIRLEATVRQGRQPYMSSSAMHAVRSNGQHTANGVQKMQHLNNLKPLFPCTFYWPNQSAELCGRCLLFRFWRILLGLFLGISLRLSRKQKIGNANLFTNFLFTILVPLDLHLQASKVVDFLLNLFFFRDLTHNCEHSTNCEQTLPKRRTTEL